MIPEKAEGGGGVNKKAKDEIFSYIKSARLSSISPRIYDIYKKNLQNVCIMKRRAKKRKGAYIMLVHRISLPSGLMRYRARC